LGQTVAPSLAESVSVAAFGVNRLAIRAKVMAPAYMVSSEIHDDGWSVTVDGKPTENYRVDYLLRGVYLDPGAHDVVYTYRPQGFIEGIFGTCCALFICVAFVIRDRRLAAFRKS
jgi:uncharacterized membrane protein YfhO